MFVRDLSMSGRPVVLRWRKRRWRCTYCSKTWTESHPQVPPRARMTLRFKEHLATRAAAQGNFSKVALSERVSYDTVARAHKVRADLVRKLRPRLAPKVISIDEASVRRGFNYNTVVTDVLARYVIGTIPGRRQDALVRWFAELDEEVREGIEVVIMDMARFYRASISRILPHAVVVVDKVPRHPSRQLRPGPGSRATPGTQTEIDTRVAPPLVSVPLRASAVHRQPARPGPLKPHRGLRCPSRDGPGLAAQGRAARGLRER